MQYGQFQSHVSHAQLARTDSRAEIAAEFLETGGLLALQGRTAAVGCLDNEIHLGKQANAAFEITCRLPASGGQAKFAVLS
jgi:hypothetical protein